MPETALYSKRAIDIGSRWWYDRSSECREGQPTHVGAPPSRVTDIERALFVPPPGR